PAPAPAPAPAEAARSSAALHDNAGLLAGLQGALASQAKTLAARAQARQLVASDPKIRRFVDSMKKAAAAMQPAARQLAATDLQAAIAPEQQALQYLMQAASAFTDVQVAMQRGGGGNGGQSDRDLSQIYQLEMDLHKNQYESSDDASPQARARQNDALSRRLQSLAQREQQLAGQLQHSAQLTPEQRWQQQTLRREAQDLQQQFSQQAGANASSSAAQASRAQGSQPHASQPGAQPGTQPGSSAGASPGGAVLAGRLNDAIRAMGQAEAAMRAGGSDGAARARSAAQQAGNALSGAGTQLARERAQAMQQSIGALAGRAGQLYSQQAAAQADLQSAAAAAARRGTHGNGVLDRAQQAQLTQQKQQLSAGVERLGDQIAAAATRYRRDSPQTSAALTGAGRVVADNGLVDRLGNAALAIGQGQSGYVLPGEAGVTQAMRELRDRLQSAARTAGGAVAGARALPDALATQLSQVRARRIQLQRLADAKQAGSAGAGRDAPVSAQLRMQISQLEQRELQLERREQPEPAVRAAVTNPGADQYREAVAEYYRRLGRQ
ncbi:MAG: hypothetical protein ACREU2_01420, partial [Steroidobacteraceae bacterium]